MKRNVSDDTHLKIVLASLRLGPQIAQLALALLQLELEFARHLALVIQHLGLDAHRLKVICLRCPRRLQLGRQHPVEREWGFFFWKGCLV